MSLLWILMNGLFYNIFVSFVYLFFFPYFFVGVGWVIFLVVI